MCGTPACSTRTGIFFNEVNRPDLQNQSIYATANQSKLKPRIRADGPGELGNGGGQGSEFLASETAEDRERAVVTDEAIASEDPAPDDESDVGQPVALEVEDQNAASSDAGHLVEQTS